MLKIFCKIISDKNKDMSSTESHHKIVANKLAPDTIVSFKAGSELKQYITNKTKITKKFFAFGEIMAILCTIIEEEKQYQERNPQLIICSEELKEIVKCPALHYNDLKSEVVKHLAFTHEYIDEVKDTTSHVPQSNCIKCSSWLRTDVYQLKSPFLELIQGMPGHVNPKRTVFTYQEISDLMCIYFYHRRDQFFRDQDDKACWIKGDPLESCFDVEGFHWKQLRPLIMAQLIPLRRSPRNTN